MSSASFYKWRAKYGGMDTSMVPRLKKLAQQAILNNAVSIRLAYQAFFIC